MRTATDVSGRAGVPDGGAAAVRGQIYALLAAGFRRPDEAHHRYLAGSYVDEWAEILSLVEDDAGLLNPVTRLRSALQSSTFASLEQEHTRLFEPHGELLAPPYETEYTKETPQHVLTESAQLADIAGFYRAFGLEISETNPERADHIATELEFMHILATKESDAATHREEKHLEIIRDAQRKFLADHLARWTGRFRDRLLQTQSNNGVYSLLGKLTADWIELDQGLLGS